jgi:preprotein translocase subunit SecY
MGWYDNLINMLPEVAPPTEKRLGFKTKLKWTGIILLIYFVLKYIPLFGLGRNSLEQFQSLSIILGASFGSVISLGIGPIVTASIVLQLVNGSGLFKFDLNSHEGKSRFQGTQKLLAVFFVIFEAGIYVFMGGLTPNPALVGTSTYFSLQLILVFQLLVGGLMIMIMDEIISKWGLGSGISLFIAAGVSESLFIRLFSFLKTDTGEFIGAIPAIMQNVSIGQLDVAFLLFFSIIATLLVFTMAVYAQAMKIEIPLSFGRVRGHGIRWPLNFLYTSNLPVILIAALLANIQLGATLLSGKFGWNAQTVTAWVNPPNIVGLVIQNKTLLIGWLPWAQVLVYTLILVIGAMVFSFFWVQTSGMDSRSQAKQIMQSGLQIPGFRRDPRVMEHLLDRYIMPLTIMGGAVVGFLAAVADVSGALSRGTGILLTVMIIYKLYEDTARQHMMDMNPMMKKFMGK